MLQKPILSGRIGKWAYALVEYDLAYESLKSVKGQIVADLLLNIRLMMSMIWKSVILLAHHGNCTLMDRFVMTGEELVLVMFSSLQVVLFLNYKPIGRILHKQSS